METHSGILIWEIPWTEEPGELQSIGPIKFRNTLNLCSLLSPLFIPKQKDFSQRLCHPHSLNDSSQNQSQMQCSFMSSRARLEESESEFAQSCPTPCNPMDYSSPGSSVHRIFQAGVLEWVVCAHTLALQ